MHPLGLVVVHGLPRARVVRRIRERVVVRGPVHYPPVGEVPGGDRWIGLEGPAETGHPGVRRVEVFRRVADVGPVEHRVVERRLVLDRLALDLVARGHELDRDVLAPVGVRQDLEELERQDPAVRKIQDAVVRQLHGRVEDPGVRGADREQARVDGEIADVPARRVAYVMVQRDDPVLAQPVREEVRQENVERIGGLQIWRPQSEGHRVREDDRDVVRGTEKGGPDRGDGQARGLQSGGDGRSEVLVVQPEVGVQETNDEDRDSRRLVLGRDELARDLVAVLEVVGDRRVDSTVDRLEPVVPPGEERGPELRGHVRVLGRKPPPRGRVVVSRLREAVPERAEVERRPAGRVVAWRPQERGEEVRHLLIVLALQLERDRCVDGPPHVR